MIIPIPCEFGEKAKCNDRELPFVGISWFRWSEGIEYTYFFYTHDEWQPFDFYTTFQKEQSCSFEIPDILIKDGFIKEKNYPLKGRGYAYGLKYHEEKFYMEFIMSSMYNLHIKIQCDRSGVYVPGGDIIFPPSFDTEEKMEKAMLKSFKIIHGSPLEIKAHEPEPKQLTIFDFIK